MAAPTKHRDEFTNKRNAPAMNALEEGDRIKITYNANQRVGQKKTRGTIQRANVGPVNDIIEFIPDSRDNLWRLCLGNATASLEYYSAGIGSSWRTLDTRSDNDEDPLVAKIL